MFTHNIAHILNTSQTISLYQPMLQAIAMRMVGSLADAEDIVQDTFMRWLTTDREKIVNTKAYLIKAVTNSCLNHLTSIKEKKKRYLETISPAEISFYKEFEMPKFDLENELSSALAIMQAKLDPMEKAVYMLREVFGMEYDELQEILDKKKDNCRQLFARAKKNLNDEAQKFKIDMNRHRELLEGFKKSCDMGNTSEIIAEVMKDVAAKFRKGSDMEIA